MTRPNITWGNSIGVDREQIDSFEHSLRDGQADPDALYLVWAGSNNFLGVAEYVPIGHQIMIRLCRTYSLANDNFLKAKS